MKIRKFIHTAMILIIAVSVSSVTYASMPLKDIIDEQSVNYSPEKDIVLNAQINSKMKPKDFLCVKFAIYNTFCAIHEYYFYFKNILI